MATDQATSNQATLKLRGMSCAACARNVEQAIRSVSGVLDCAVNFGAEQASVTYDAQRVDLSQIQAAVSEAGYSASPRNRSWKSGQMMLKPQSGWPKLGNCGVRSGWAA